MKAVPHETFTLDDARAIAREVPANQTDKLGEPYMVHVEAVADGLADFDLELQIAGMLHDVVEDAFEEIGREVTIDDLRNQGVPERSRAAIAAVSSNLYPAGMTYFEKIEQICTSPDAVLVKISDNAHNSLPERVAALEASGVTPSPKYADARRLLYDIADRDDVERILSRANPALLPEIA